MKAKTTWNLSDELLKLHSLREEISWTTLDACQGLMVFGGIGSGKTSASLTHIPLAMLRGGFGGLVLCTKMDESERFQNLCQLAGREEDMILFGPGYTNRYNFLEELKPGGSEAVIKAFKEVNEGIFGGRTQVNEWSMAADQHLRNILDLFRLAGRPFQIPEIRLATSDIELHESILRTISDCPDKEMLSSYFLKEWATMGEKTRSSVLMSLNPTLDPFARGDLRQLFCADSSIRPEDMRTQGKIIIINIPILDDADQTGRAAAVIWKYMTLRRLQKFFGNGKNSSSDETRPVFICADECQYFATREDAVAQGSARSSRICTMYATQNIPNFHMRSSPKAKEETASLLANLRTRILHQNDCPETAEWFNRVLGKEWQERHGQSVDFHSEGGGGASSSQSKEIQIEPWEFAKLASGDKPFKNVVTGFYQRPGKAFQPKGRSWTQIAFQQLPRK